MKNIKNVLILICISLSLVGCDNDKEFEIKDGYTYTSTNIKVTSQRMFTRNGEVVDNNTISAIFDREQKINDMEFPKSQNIDNDDKFSVTFNNGNAVIKSHTEPLNFTFTRENDFILFTSVDTLIVYSLGVEPSIPGAAILMPEISNHIGIHIPAFYQVVPLNSSTGYANKVITKQEIYAYFEPDGFHVPYLFYHWFHTDSDGMRKQTASASFNNELNVNFYSHLDEGDTILVQEMVLYLK